jgi:hypothetical protein
MISAQLLDRLRHQLAGVALQSLNHRTGAEPSAHRTWRSHRVQYPQRHLPVSRLPGCVMGGTEAARRIVNADNHGAR